LFDPEPEVGCRLPIKQLDEPQKSVWCSILFDPYSKPVRCRDGSRCPDVPLVCCRCSGALSLLQCRRCSLSLFGVRCSMTSELPGVCSTRSAQYETAMATKCVSAIYTIFEGWAIGLQCRRRRQDGRSLPILSTVGNWFQTGFLA